MTTRSDFDAALAAARSKRLGKTVTVKRTYDDIEVTFEFHAEMPGDATEMLASFEALGAMGDNASPAEALRAIRGFLDTMATDDTKYGLDQFVAARLIDLEGLLEIAVEVAEVVTGRPFTKSSSLPSPSPGTGAPSTAGAPS